VPQVSGQRILSTLIYAGFTWLFLLILQKDGTKCFHITEQSKHTYCRIKHAY
jgi:phage/plasmid primase-like uncharacterized protein